MRPVWQAWYTSQYATWRSAAHTNGPPSTPIHSRTRPRPYTRSRASGGSSSASVASAGLEEVWSEVDDDIDWNPREHHEIPVHGVLAHVHEPFRSRLVEQHRFQHDRVDEIREQVRRMEAEEHPHDRPVGVCVPAAVQGAELEHADNEKREREQQAHPEPELRRSELQFFRVFLRDLVRHGAG